MVVDIVETKRVKVTVFTALSERGRRWMRGMFGGKTEVTYGLAEGTSDFRREARKARLIISTAKR